MKIKLFETQVFKIPVLVSLSISATFFVPTSGMSGESSDTKKQRISATKLSYIEREPGVDDYRVTMLVSDRYIRIDEVEEESGYIIYDDKDKIIYSVSHGDRSILVIKSNNFSNKKIPTKSFVEYLPLVEAPKVAEKRIFNYRVFVKQDEISSTKEKEVNCMEIQLAEGLFPKIRVLLQNYQRIISGQQVKMVDNIVNDIQTPCYYVDQVYNEGHYYKKGLPIQEWHSNDKLKALTSYKKIEVETRIFTIPKDYRQFSMDANSKRSLQ